jgi:hypothetical protein
MVFSKQTRCLKEALRKNSADRVFPISALLNGIAERNRSATAQQLCAKPFQKVGFAGKPA